MSDPTRRGGKPVEAVDERGDLEARIVENRAAEVELRLVIRRLRIATRRYEERLRGPVDEG